MLPLSGRVVRTPEDQLVRLAAEESDSAAAATEKCMADAGFPSVSMSVHRPVLMVLARPYGMAEAEQRGLNRARALAELQDDPPSAPESVSNTDIASTRAAMDKAADCDRSQVADGKLTSLVDQYRSEVLDDERISTARRSWSECMVVEGFPVTSVSELANSMVTLDEQQLRSSLVEAKKRSFDDDLLSKEIPAAQAVVRCDEKALFPAFPHLAELEEEWMDAHAQELRALRETDRILWGVYVDL